MASAIVEGWDIERFRDERITPVELWDVPWRDGIVADLFEPLRVWSHFRPASYPVADSLPSGRDVAVFVEELLSFTDCLWRGDIKELRNVAGFEELVLMGGMTELPDFDCLVGSSSEGYVVSVYPNGPFGPLDGGSWVEQNVADARAPLLVVDVGQAAIKVRVSCGCSSDGSFPRDLSSVPLASDQQATQKPSSSRPPAYRESIDFVARAATSVANLCDCRFRRVVLAFPCAIAGDGTLMGSGCTYPGWNGGMPLVSDVVSEIAKGLQPRNDSNSVRFVHDRPGHVWVLNDAELAAAAVISARSQSDASSAPVLPVCTRADVSRTLIVTLGFGPGGAVVEL